MNEVIAKEIMAKSSAGYDKIAARFSQTRNYFWPELAFVKKYIKNGDKILDIGCGNGRFLGFLMQPTLDIGEFSYTGIDNSKELVKIAQEIYSVYHKDGPFPQEPSFLVADALDLPFENETFDVVVSFAVLHHIPSQALREKFVSEAARVLKKDGIFILSVWDLWQKKYFPIMFKNAVQKILGLSNLDFKDFFLGFGAEKDTRFLHAFIKKEIKKLVSKNFKIKELLKTKSHSKHRNFVIIAKKQ